MTRNALLFIVGAIIIVLGGLFLLREPDAVTPEQQVGGTNGPGMDSPRGDRWFGATTTVQGIAFSYPDPFPGRYVTAVSWPPLVEETVNEYTCTDGPITAADGPLKSMEKRIINGREYCRTTTIGGAAGSTYTDYEYATEHEGKTLRAVFTLRTVQCLNFDEPERDACMREQETFDVDDIADRIIRSVRRE